MITDPINEQLELINILVNLGRTQENDIENIGQSITLPDEAVYNVPIY